MRLVHIFNPAAQRAREPQCGARGLTALTRIFEPMWVVFLQHLRLFPTATKLNRRICNKGNGGKRDGPDVYLYLDGLRVAFPRQAFPRQTGLELWVGNAPTKKAGDNSA